MSKKNPVPPFFSIVVYIDKISSLEHFMDSFAGEPSFFYGASFEVILLDPECSIETINICNEVKARFPDNTFVYEISGMSLAAGYNYAITKVRGFYINFNLSSSYFTEGSLDHIKNNVRKYSFPELITASPWTVNENQILSQYLISPRIYDGKDELIDLSNDTGCLDLCLHSYFIRRNLVLNNGNVIWFSELGYDTAQNYIIRLLAIVGKYVYVSYAFYYYTVPMEDNTSAFVGQYNIDWYTNTMKNSLFNVAGLFTSKSEKIPVFVQYAILWSLFTRFNCNYNDRNKGIINYLNKDDFYSEACEVLRTIDDDVIWNKGRRQTFSIPRTIRLFLLELKTSMNKNDRKLLLYSDNLWNVEAGPGVSDEIIISSIISSDIPVSEPTYSINNRTTLPELKKNYQEERSAIEAIRISQLKSEHVLIDIINYSNGKFTIDGRCSLGDFGLADKCELLICINGEYYPTKQLRVYTPNLMFGEPYQHKWRFQVSINNEWKGLVFFFVARINGDYHKLKIRSGGVYAHINIATRNAYWRFSQYGYLKVDEDQIIVKNSLKTDYNALEVAFCKELSRIGNDFAKRAIKIRSEYFKRVNDPNKQRKRIWVSFDKLYKAGDNGEYIFHYIRKKAKDIDMYYLIKEDSPDYPRLKELYSDHILTWGEDYTVVSMLMAETILATHANIISNAGISKEMIPYLSDLFNPINICIQHGLTVQNIAQYQNRIFDNTMLYVLASPNEYKNINTPEYGYNENMIRITGMARYDGLKSNPQKQILISPTWRRNVANSNIAHFKKSHNEYFKHSTYFRLYNALINDTKLSETAKKYGYKIIYLIHPAVSSQIDDFEKNDYVYIIPAAGDVNYEKILTESDLLVTDYSGIQFDFAYMKKPLLYYHPASLPPHYSESDAYKYDRDSFGPVIDNHEELVDQLCEYMSDGCKMKDLYRERVDKFFAYRDFRNCNRIYDAVREFVDKRKDG